MDIQLNSIPGGGLFSLFHLCLEEIIFLLENNEISLSTLKSFKLVLPKDHVFRKKMLFDDIFLYDKNEAKIFNAYTRHFKFNNASDDKEILVLLKKIVNKNTINPSILNQVNYYKDLFNINENTLGVHVRLTDMNAIHGDIYGTFTTEDYIFKIDDFLNRHKNINNVFIASDNIVSINKIEKYYNDKDITISYINDIDFREPQEYSENTNYVVNKFNEFNLNFHVNIFMEMLVLSKCAYLIHRTSDFSNASIIYSDTFKDIIRLNS
jgi:hypothetical protein